MDPNPKDPMLFKKSVFAEVQVYNRNLKLLAKRANAVRPLTNKTVRHTNAQIWIRFDADRPIFSKIMGHVKEQATQNYCKEGWGRWLRGQRELSLDLRYMNKLKLVFTKTIELFSDNVSCVTNYPNARRESLLYTRAILLSALHIGIFEIFYLFTRKDNALTIALSWGRKC